MNHMIANPDKFKAIILDKQNSDFSNTKISVNNEKPRNCSFSKTPRNPN